MTTHSGYSRAVVLITSCVGARGLQSLSPIDIESLYARLLSSGRRDRSSLSPKTVRHAHRVLRCAFADAEPSGLVVRNAAAVARPPALSRVEFPTWSADELGTFLEFVADDRLSAAWVLLASTGMRRGEALGLRWAHVDLDDASLSIVSSLTTVGNVSVSRAGARAPNAAASLRYPCTTTSGLAARLVCRPTKTPPEQQRAAP
jgi:integrase